MINSCLLKLHPKPIPILKDPSRSFMCPSTYCISAPSQPNVLKTLFAFTVSTPAPLITTLTPCRDLCPQHSSGTVLTKVASNIVGSRGCFTPYRSSLDVIGHLLLLETLTIKWLLEQHLPGCFIYSPDLSSCPFANSSSHCLHVGTLCTLHSAFNAGRYTPPLKS